MRSLLVQSSEPIRLRAWLAREFPDAAPSAVARALRQRDIRVNGSRVGQDMLLQPGDAVAVYIDDRLLLPLVETVWMDGNLIVAVKPQGVISVGEGGMAERVSRWLAGRGEDATAMACHRLDSATGGLLMLARNPVAEAAVRAQMEAGSIQKTYHCVVRGAPQPPQATATAWLLKDEDRAQVSVHDRPLPGGRTAVTEYRTLAVDGGCTLLAVTLHTGRTHQIRAHLAHLGHPLLGDDKYGDRAFNRAQRARRLMLWASALRFGFSAQDCPMLGALAGQTLGCRPPFLEGWKLPENPV